MRWLRTEVLALGLLLLAGVAGAADVARPRSDFLPPPSLRDVALSPDGRQVAYLHEQGKRAGAWLLEAEGGEPRALLLDTPARRLHWSRDGRWLFLEATRGVQAVSVDGQGRSGLVLRLDRRFRQEVAGTDPALPAALLILEQAPGKGGSTVYRLLRLDPQGKRSLLHQDTRPMVDFAIAPDGRLAWLKLVEGDHHLLVRVGPDGSTTPVLRCERLERCRLLATTVDGGLWVDGDVGGDLRRLLRLDSEGRLHTEHADPLGVSDLDEVVVDPLTGQPLVAAYRSTVAANYGLAAAIETHLATLRQRFPDRDLGLAIGHGEGAHWLISERSDRLQSPRWHLYDPAQGQLREILATQGAESRRLPESALATRQPITWTASDGMRLHGFLTLPPGADPARAPLVVMPHGGPWQHARPGYSPMAQFLASRGNVVFEPNFRGSTGHGRRYLFAARGDFGNGRVQRDIVEGTRALLAQGLGDPGRVAIAGASFGGYSALQGVSFEPDLFQLAIAGVPPSDFGWVLRWATGSKDIALSAGIPLAYTLRHLDLDLDDPAVEARLSAQSPLANVAALRRPVLLFGAGRDQRVPIRSVSHYAATLKQAGKDVSLFVDPDAGHAMDEPLNREAYLYLVEVMLHHHLGGPAPVPPGKELAAHLRRHLKISGSALAPTGLAPGRQGGHAARPAEPAPRTP